MRPSDHPLRARTRPAFDSGGAAVRIVDLFAGCGGITLGLAQACLANGRALEVALAVDFERLATSVYQRNFAFAERIETAPVEAFFDERWAMRRHSSSSASPHRWRMSICWWADHPARDTAI